MILTESRFHHNLATVLTAIIALWGIIAEFVAAFQCGTAEPLRFVGADHRCHNLVRYQTNTSSASYTADIWKAGFWLGMGVINILTDLALIMFPIHVIITLQQMSLRKKITILVFFGARSL